MLDHTLYTYEYADNQVIINFYSSGIFISKTTAVSNADGLAVNVRLENTQIGMEWINYFNEYDGEQLKNIRIQG